MDQKFRISIHFFPLPELNMRVGSKIREKIKKLKIIKSEKCHFWAKNDLKSILFLLSKGNQNFV